MQLTSVAAAIASVIAAPMSLAGDGFLEWEDPAELDASSNLSVDLAGVGMATPLFTMVQYGPDNPENDAGGSDGGLDIKLVLDLLPGGFLISPDLDGFTIDGGFFTETIDGVGSGILTLGIGVAFDTSMISWDVELGGGVLYNAAFTAGLLVVDFTPRFKLGDHITLGPHVGVMHIFEPTWDGFSSVTLSDATGGMVGLSFTAGIPKVSFSLMVDYLFGAELGVAVPAGVTAPSELDLSGFMLRAGVIMKF